MDRPVQRCSDVLPHESIVGIAVCNTSNESVCESNPNVDFVVFESGYDLSGATYGKSDRVDL